MPITLPRPRTALLCGLLLCATLINYMDRQALTSLASRVSRELNLQNVDYGSLERGFGLAFAVGSLFFGFAADAVSVRWLYPFVLVAWSTMGIITGFARNYEDLFYCRVLLGFFEAGHWPCAMQTIRRSLSDADRGLGNSVLQSGASIGAIITPIVIEAMIPMGADGELSQEPGLWRLPFFVFGGLGLLWAAGWGLTVRKEDLEQSPAEVSAEPVGLLQTIRELLFSKRFWTLMIVVIAINTSWQFFRAWLPKSMQEGRGISEQSALRFTVVFYIATDVGCIAAGIATKLLNHWGISVFNARRLTYTFCSMLCGLAILLPITPTGIWLNVLWFLIGMGALGVFPCYYSFVQGVSERHPAKIFGILSALGWVVTSSLQKPFGGWIDRSIAAGHPNPFDQMLIMVGLMPLLAAIPVWLLWRAPKTTPSTTAESNA